MLRNHAARLKESIEARIGSPVDVRIGQRGQPETVLVDPPSASASAVVAAFDWSDDAHDVWLENNKPERKTLRDRAATAIEENDAFLQTANPAAVAIAQQVRRLTSQVNHVIRRLVQLD